jgi:hypothetical protein
MKTNCKTFAVLLGVVLISTLLTSMASAECASYYSPKAGASLQPQSWLAQSRSATLLQVSDDRHFFNEPIVGMWKVTFIAKGNVGPGLPPDGAVVDNAFAQWHSDGTEIMNSSRDPATQSFCLGVWEKVGHLRYKLNHFAISWDPVHHPGSPLGPANIREDVVLSRDGNNFLGTFTIDQYDESGNLLVHITGLLTGTRITVDTPASSLF